MGLSSNKQTTKSTETIAPSTFSAPFVTDAANQLRPGFDAASALTKKYTPTAEQGIGYYGDVMNGKYLNGNPYLDQIVNKSNSDITNAVGGQFSQAGRYGSAYNTDTLARALGDNENQLRYGNYATERGYQNQAPLQQSGLIQSLIGMQQQPGQDYAGSIGSLLGKYITDNGSSVTKQVPSIASSIGKALQLASIVASDRRLKMDISEVGREADGLGVYQYRYVTDAPDSELRTGVMADEVRELRPWALGPTRNGFMTVDMGKL